MSALTAPTRKRGHFQVEYHSGGLYDGPWVEDRWVYDPNGPTVISGTAPMFDVDYRVTCAHTDTGSVLHVHVTRRRDLRRLRRGLRHLIADGHVPADAADDVVDSITAARRHRTPVTVPVTFPVNVTRSRTPDHSHVWVEQYMDFRTAARLARALGFVDRDYIKVCSHARLWQLNSPR